VSAELLLRDDERHELERAPYQAVLNRAVQLAELQRIADREQDRAEQALETEDAGSHT
jgi:hypothetical protein